MTTENSIATLAKVQDVEFITKFTRNIELLLKVLNISQPIKLPSGSMLKMYKTKGSLNRGAPGPCQEVYVSEYENKAVHIAELNFSKYRKMTSLEDVSRMGFGQAVDSTDAHMMADIQDTILEYFFGLFRVAVADSNSEESKVSGDDLQTVMAKARGALRKTYMGFSFTPVTFISTDDLTDYLSKTEITLQTMFGLTYIEQFLNMGLTIECPLLPKGTLYATAAENLNFYYADPAQIEGFEFYTDETGIIGIKHEPIYINESFQTHAVCAGKFFPTYADKIIEGTIIPNAWPPSIESPNTESKSDK